MLTDALWALLWEGQTGPERQLEEEGRQAYFILPTAPGTGDYHCPQFTDEETGPER